MNNLKIGTRLWIGFSLVVTLIFCMAFFAYVEINNIKEQTDNLARASSVVVQQGEQKQLAEQSYGKAVAAYELSIRWLTIGCALALLIGTAAAVLISRWNPPGARKCWNRASKHWPVWA